ncbi:MAG: hypothetical protein FWC99_06400 [Coriobacteriia bacterium]|nr:hypothetical protein [Coriobacteriia bacterium]
MKNIRVVSKSFTKIAVALLLAVAMVAASIMPMFAASAEAQEALHVTSVTPQGNNVPVDTENLVITFSWITHDFMGEVVMNGQAMDSVWAGTWDEDATVFTVPMSEFGTLEPGTVYTVEITEFASGLPDNAATMEPYTHTFRTEGGTGLDYFTKTLEMPEGTTIPNASFDFTFERVQQLISETPAINSRPVAEVPTISTQTITVDPTTADTSGGSSGGTLVGGTTTVTGTLDLWALLDGLTFPGGGVYVWNVTEVADSSDTEAPSHMSYDDSIFQIRAHVDRYGNLAAIEIFDITDIVNGTATEGTKLEEGLNFTNVYRTDVGGSLEDNAFEVSKNVTGQFANTDTLFDFVLGLNANPLAPLPSAPEFTIINADGNIVDRPISVSVQSDLLGASATFRLAHGERLVIPTLPAGTSFSVLELGLPEFAPSVSVVVGGTVVHTASALPDNDLTSGDHILTDAGRNATDFTNAHQFTPPAGLLLTNAALAVVVIAAIALVLLAASRRRKAIEELPLS